MRNNAYSERPVNTVKNGRLAEVIPLKPRDDSRKTEYMEFLNAWCASMREEADISQEDFLKLDTLERMIVTRNGYLANVVGLCRVNAKQDCRMAVLAIITFFADNEDHTCRLGVVRIAQILRRREDTIRAAIDYLDQQGVIEVERLGSLPSTYRPRAFFGVADTKASIVWIADAFSKAPARRGRPAKKIYPVYGACPPAEAASCESSCEKIPRVEPENTLGGAIQELTKLLHSDLITSKREPIRGTYAHTHTHAPARRGSCRTSEHNFEGVL